MCCYSIYVQIFGYLLFIYLVCLKFFDRCTLEWNCCDTVILCLAFQEKLHCLAQQLHSFRYSPAKYKSSGLFTSFPLVSFLFYVMIATLVSIKWHLVLVLTFISLMINDVEHLSMYLLVICILFGGKISTSSLPTFNWVACLFVVEL